MPEPSWNPHEVSRMNGRQMRHELLAWINTAQPPDEPYEWTARRKCRDLLCRLLPKLDDPVQYRKLFYRTRGTSCGIQMQVAEAMRRCPTIKPRDLAEALHIDVETIYHNLHELRRSGVIPKRKA